MSSSGGNGGLILFAGIALAGLITLITALRRKDSHQRQSQPHTTRSDVSICIICCGQLLREKTQKLPCGHKFHEKCINLVLEKEVEKSCPHCRRLL